METVYDLWGGWERPGWGKGFDWCNSQPSGYQFSASPPILNNTHTHTLRCSQSANITAQPASNSPDYNINNLLSDRDLNIISSLLGMSYIGYNMALHQYIRSGNESTHAFYNEEPIQHCANLPASVCLEHSCSFSKLQFNLSICHCYLTPA